MRWVAIAALLASAAVGGCSTKQEPVKASDIRGAVVLEQTTWDLGWSYSMRGMYIDGDGNVWSFEQHGNPWYQEKLKQGEMTERDMLAKHKGARKIGTVDPALLLDMAQLIPAAEKGKITRAAGSGEGSGTLQVAYRLDQSTKVYHEIILAGSGERTATNSSTAAKSLIDYLENVQRLVEYK